MWEDSAAHRDCEYYGSIASWKKPGEYDIVNYYDLCIVYVWVGVYICRTKGKGNLYVLYAYYANYFLLCTLNGSFTHVGFIVAHRSHWKNIALLSYKDLPYADAFHYTLF